MIIVDKEEMTAERLAEEQLDRTSDVVRDFAHKMAMLKAISKVENGIAPEDFDRAWNREFAKAWDKLKDKSAEELAIIGMLEMLSNGVSLEEMFGESEEK